ncbi:MAG: AAA family ATPase [Acidobacteria bacterium]|nr:AAA family ATPase [Acidobacteriota bacterium]
MAAGKTAVAEALARQLDCSMLDLDQFIAASAGRSIQTIIDEDGEARFRQMEESALRKALVSGTARVIALGGGTWISPRNRALIAEHHGFTVWLDAPYELCWQRIVRTGDTRPLARDYVQAGRLYKERRPLYELAALRVQINEETNAGVVATEIVNALRQHKE